MFYWPKVSPYPLLISGILALTNGLIHRNGFLIASEVVENFNIYLKNYYFIAIDNKTQQLSGWWLAKKVENQWSVVWIKPWINNGCQSIVNFFKNKFPLHYGFFLGILLGIKDYFQPYKFFNHLGLGHYTALSGVHVNYMVKTILVATSWVGPTIIGSYYGSLMIVTFFLFFLNYINPTPSIMRASLSLILNYIHKIFYWNYNPWFCWWLCFLMVHTWNPITIYGYSFLMSFFLTPIMFLNNQDFLLDSKSKIKYLKFVLINLLILLFMVHGFSQFNLFYFLFNIIFQDFFNVMIIIGFISCWIPWISKWIDHVFHWTLPLIKFLSGHSIFISTGTKGNFYYLILFLFLLYGVLMVKFIKVIDIIFYWIFLLVVYWCLLFFCLG
jgi:ComEC/Rec2-related protein